MNIIDTFLVHNQKAPYVDDHLARSFEALNKINNFDDYQALKKLYTTIIAKAPLASEKIKVQITFSSERLNDSVVKYSNLDHLPEIYRLKLADRPLNDAEYSKATYKTDQRQHWTEFLDSCGTDDVIAYNKYGYITETSRFNIYVINQEACFTPPLSSGCLDGVLRKILLKQGFIHFNGLNYPLMEKNINIDELFKAHIILGNSLRGLIPSKIKLI